jgi:hypothetical protein
MDYTNIKGAGSYVEPPSEVEKLLNSTSKEVLASAKNEQRMQDWKKQVLRLKKMSYKV